MMNSLLILDARMIYLLEMICQKSSFSSEKLVIMPVWDAIFSLKNFTLNTPCAIVRGYKG